MFHRSRPALGTFVTISAVGRSSEAVHSAITAAFEEFDLVDRLMSVHREDSELSRVNREAAGEAVKISEPLFSVIAQAQEIAAATDGSFDVTIGPLADLWGFIWKEYRMPSEAELAAVMPLVDYQAVKLGEDRTIRFLKPGISIDLGGIGKGYAVDRAIMKLQELGIPAAMVKAGGDLRVYGKPPGREEGWVVQLEDPRKKGERVAIRLADAALSTSGNYENYFEVEGKRFSHIIDPRSGLPVEGIASCTVIAPTCLQSDALATAFFIFGVERSIQEFGDRYPIRFTLFPEGKSVSTRNFSKVVASRGKF